MMLDYRNGVAEMAALAPKTLAHQRLVKAEYQGSLLWQEWYAFPPPQNSYIHLVNILGH